MSQSITEATDGKTHHGFKRAADDLRAPGEPDTTRVRRVVRDELAEHKQEIAQLRATVKALTELLVREHHVDPVTIGDRVREAGGGLESKPSLIQTDLPDTFRESRDAVAARAAASVIEDDRPFPSPPRRHNAAAPALVKRATEARVRCDRCWRTVAASASRVADDATLCASCS